MSWEELATITLTPSWQLTDLTRNQLFRVRHQADITDSSTLRAAIAQAIDIDPLTLYDLRRLAWRIENEALVLALPEGFEERKLAVRRLDGTTGNWILTIEVSDLPMDGATSDEIRAELAAGLATKASATHTHAIAWVDGLQVALDAKAPTNHSHAIAAVDGLQSALNAKAPKIYLVAQTEPRVVSSTTAQTDLFTALIPGGTLNVGNFIRISYLFSATNNANGKGVIFKLNNAVIQTSYAINNNSQLAGTRTFAVRTPTEIIWIAGLTIGIGVTTSTTPIKLTVNLAQDQTLAISGQLANASDTLTLEYVLAELIA